MQIELQKLPIKHRVHGGYKVMIDMSEHGNEQKELPDMASRYTYILLLAR